MFSSMMGRIKDGCSQLFRSRHESLTQGNVDQANSHPVSPSQTDSESLQRTFYSQNHFLAKKGPNYPGMCAGTALLKVTEQGPEEEKAFELQSEFLRRIDRINSNLPPDYRTDFNDRVVTIDVIGQMFSELHEEKVKTKPKLQDDDGCPMDALALLRRKSESSTTPRTWFLNGTSRKYNASHLFRFYSTGDGNCSSYEGNKGEVFGQCHRVLDELEDSFKNTYDIIEVDQVSISHKGNKKTFK